MSRRPLALLLLLGLVGGLVALSPPARTGLRAGVATVDITPVLGSTMLGYVRPDIATDGVHTRLTGRALVLDDGDTPVALVATDLGFPLRKDDLVARVADLGYTSATVLYHASHTHAGPEALDDWQVDQLARAIRRAHASRVPVAAGWGTAEVPRVNRNRSVEAHLANHGMDLFPGQGAHDDDPNGAAHTRDTTVRVLRIDRADGSGPLTAWTHFPVHLTTVTPANSLWDADLAGTATWHLAERVEAGQHDDHVDDRDGFTAIYANGAQGDLMPRFDGYNPQALVDLHGRRLARGAHAAWRAAGTRLTDDVVVDMAWTRACYCGQEVEPGRRVSDRPVWGLPFLGGSEDGASIFHEPLATEGRRRPAALADPVHGRKIPAAPSEVLDVHDRTPEFAALRIGDRVLLAAPGEPSVEMGRRFVDAVRGVLPADVTEAFNVGLANGYLGYLVTPEEYETQHYEGGHTVYGTWTSLLARNEFVGLAERLAAGDVEVADGTGSPPTLVAPAPGDGGTQGHLRSGPSGTVERMTVVEVTWTGAPGGLDRPADTPLVALQRREGGRWVTAESDLGVAVVWTERDGTYTARIDLQRALPLGRHRVVVTSGAYTLPSAPFDVVASRGLRLRGAEVVTDRQGRRVLRIVGQNPPPDPDRAVLWRPVNAPGGTVTLRLAGRTLTATWDVTTRAWTVRLPGHLAVDVARVAPGGVVDGAGNTNATGYMLDLTAGIAPAEWPDHIGVGGGRTPGPFGEGSFPP